VAEPLPSWVPPWEAGLSALAGLALLMTGVGFHTVIEGRGVDVGALLEEPLVWTLIAATPLFTALGWMLGERRRERSLWFDEWQASTERGMRDLAQREWLIRGILQTAFDAMLVVDDDLVIVDANPIATRIFGYELEDLIGSSVERVLPDRQQLGTTLAIERRTAGGEVLGKEWQTRARHAAGHHFPVDLNMVGMREPGLLVYVVREASTRVRAERKRLDDMRAEMLGKSKARRQERSARLMGLGDEVRAEVDRLLGPLQSDGGVSDEVADAAYAIVERLEKLHELSMWEKGSQTVSFAPTSIEPLLTTVVRAVQPIARRNRNALEVRIDDGIDLVETDAVRLASAVRALASNACSYCRDGQVKVQVVREPGRQFDWVAIYVSDTGPGMSDEQLARAFRLLGSDPTGSPPPKRGLGLALAHRQAKALGGHLSVSSNEAGCTVTLRVPESRPKLRDPATPPPLRLDSGA
jgi:PAS domain S-box-containing protein